MHSLSSLVVDMDTEKLEAEILRTITHVSRSHDLKVHVNRRYLEHLAKLRNLIAAYRLGRSEAEIDDLAFAIIRDSALTIEQIQISFDLNDGLFALMIERMRERDRV